MDDEFLEIFGDFLQTTVDVRTYEGDGNSGPIFAAPRQAEEVLVEYTTRLIMASNGQGKTSDTRLYVRLSYKDWFKLESEVTLASGAKLKVGRLDSFEVFGFPAHAVVYLV